MKLVGMMLARNEDWIIGLSARVALMWCDGLVVLDHASTDRTPQIIQGLMDEYGLQRFRGSRIESQSWDEMNHRQFLYDQARAMGATHVAIVDADEILTGNMLNCIGAQVEQLRPGCILRVSGYNLRGSITRYHSTGIWANRTFSLAFLDAADLCWQGDRFHHREPFSNTGKPFPREETIWRNGRQGGGIMHLWGASERRLKAKHAWYKMTERLRWAIKSAEQIDQMYSWAIRGSGSARDNPTYWQFSSTPAEWWAPYTELMFKHLDVDADPWQEKACREMIEQHGRDKFTGLDLFGVA